MLVCALANSFKGLAVLLLVGLVIFSNRTRILGLEHLMEMLFGSIVNVLFLKCTYSMFKIGYSKRKQLEPELYIKQLPHILINL